MIPARSTKKNLKENKYKIAVIDDDIAIQSLIQLSVENTFDEVEMVKFGDAQQTIYELWEADPLSFPHIDLLFLDIHLENKTNGLDIMEYCQYIPKEMPIVLMSSSFSNEQLKQISRMSIDPILLIKPFGPTEIIGMAKWIFRI